MQKIKERKLYILLLVVILVLVIGTSGCGGGNTPWNGYSKQSFYFDTICEITIFGFEEGQVEDDTQENFDKVSNEVITDTFKLMSDFENTLSRTVEGSDVDRINKAKGEAVQVSPETLEVIEKGMEFGDVSGGTFDITVGKASVLWDFHESITDEPSEVPSEEALKEASKHIDYRKIQVDEKAGTVKLTDPEMMLDLGGIAKGYIADKTAEYLRSKGVVSAIVNLGGNIEVIGGKNLSLISEDQEQADFVLGIRDPGSADGGLLGVYPGKDITVVTSGTYERFIEVDGVRYHHILDPKTGYPVDTDVEQVSIIASYGHSVDCDGLSTACLALGVEKSTELIQALNDDGRYGNIEGIFVSTEGEVTYTKEETVFKAN
ncbi:MAG: FAD:protein FMN transferase [Firmicutes bacterium]|nr:FAD:protein FMN transferase [Bacillota bacterium]MBQ6088833.1 FAD:protein FMN transferase [Bacillota bacterium]